MCTLLLPPSFNPTAVKKVYRIISYHIIYHIIIKRLIILPPFEIKLPHANPQNVQSSYTNHFNYCLYNLFLFKIDFMSCGQKCCRCLATLV